MIHVWILGLLNIGFLSGCHQLNQVNSASINQHSSQGDDSVETIFDTGLYLNQANLEIAIDVRYYQPNFELWTDGASKKRWIKLPGNSQIDTRDINRWAFPVGTKIWKEFSFGGKRVETRLIEKVAEGASIDSWVFKAFQWNQDETNAELAPRLGVQDAFQTEFGTTHDIPRITQCTTCHNRGGDAPLSFDAIQLSGAGEGVRLSDLINQELITDAPEEEPQIPARNAVEESVLGYLHANCGSCHNPLAAAGRVTGLDLRHQIGNQLVDELPAVATSKDSLTRYFQVPDRQIGVDSFVVESGSPETSALFIRNNTRGGYPQMPPYGTKVVDEHGLQLIRQWIEGL